MAKHQATEIAELVLETGAMLLRQSERLADGPLQPAEQLRMAYAINRNALKLNQASERIRSMTRGTTRGSKRTTVPPDQEQGTVERIAS